MKRGPYGASWPLRAGAIVLLICLVPVLAGCAARTGVPEYGDVLDRWTRSMKIFSGFEARAYVYATYKSPGFREAYIRKYSESYRLSEAYGSELAERELESAAKYNEFFVAVYTPVEKWNDLHREVSVWNLYLEDETGARVEPVSVKKLDADSPLVREFFPFFDLWSSAYTIRFPRYAPESDRPIPSEETAEMRLIMTGVLGSGEITWTGPFPSLHSDAK